MLSADHLNIDGPPLAVKCVRKFGSALGGEVTFDCVCMWGGGGGDTTLETSIIQSITPQDSIEKKGENEETENIIKNF